MLRALVYGTFTQEHPGLSVFNSLYIYIYIYIYDLPILDAKLIMIFFFPLLFSFFCLSYPVKVLMNNVKSF